MSDETGGVRLRDAIITESRWQITIAGRDQDGKFVSYVASADGYLTHGDGIWFGTSDEYAEAIAL